MVQKRDINVQVNKLKLKAAQKHKITPDECHVGHLVLQGLLERPNTCHQIDGATGKKETNLSVAIRSTRLASAMRNSGLMTGDHVVLIDNNHLDLVVPFYACHYNGYPLCGVDPNISEVDLKQLFAKVYPKIVFCQKSLRGRVLAAFRSCSSNGQIVTFDDEVFNLERYIEKYNGSELNFSPALFDHSKTTAWLMLTSGTTGQSKVAIVPFETLLNGVCCWWTPITDAFEITLCMATIQWMSTLMFLISGPIIGFTRLQSSTQLTPQSLVGIINKYRPNATAWTPYLLGRFLKAAENVCDMSSFQHITIGGSAIEKLLVEKFREKYRAFLFLAYGMTELFVPVFIYDESTPFGSTGIPSDKYQFKLTDDDNQALLKPYQTGELWIKGQDFFKGYLNDKEETDKILTQDGWLKTGDMFYRDEQNYYYFVERKRLLIKHFGFLISPLQMEEIIKRHPGVQEACVVGLPDPDCMEIPIAAILKKDNATVSHQEIFDSIKAELSDHKQLRGGIFFVNSFPETPSGKLHRSKVKELAMVAPKIMPN